MGRSTVFVVGADTAVRDSVKTLVESAGLKAENFPSLRAFVDAVEPGSRGCLLFDARADDLGDREALATLIAARSLLGTEGAYAWSLAVTKDTGMMSLTLSGHQEARQRDRQDVPELPDGELSPTSLHGES